MGEPDVGDGEALVYACPMHPEVISDEPGRCPECGMKLIAAGGPDRLACPMHPEVTSETPDRCPECGMKLIPAQLVRASGGTTHARPRPRPRARARARPRGRGRHRVGRRHGRGQQAHDPGEHALEARRPLDDAENHAIDWQFRVGDRVKIRLVNEMDSDHPMHHPFHIHGAGRFLILARDGAVEPNLVWKDTVLVRTGETVDILLDVTNLGRWMAHCHIAEHHESGMMFSFDVTA